MHQLKKAPVDTLHTYDKRNSYFLSDNTKHFLYTKI